MTWWRRFLVRGVFWRQFLRWAVLNVPDWIKPAILSFWSFFFLAWGPGRRGVMSNLSAILPGSTAIANFFRCYAVFWNFAWTIADNVAFKEMRIEPEWEFTGWEHFQEMESRGGAILLTAHMGSYDLGAHVFATVSKQRIVMVRAPEVDPQTRGFEERHGVDTLQVAFNTASADLAIELLYAVREGAIVAIQGDRTTPGITELPATLFGKKTRIPSGPFALALAARVPIYPVFVMRSGYRRYHLITGSAIELARTRDRDADIAAAAATWTRDLEQIIRGSWEQWFTFEPFSPELT